MAGASATEAEICVLLVEDNQADADIIQHLLARATQRFRVTHVKLLRTTLPVLAHEAFDVLLLDLRLPDSDGIATLVRLREAAPQTPIIVVTGLDDRDLAVQAIAAGARDFFVKDRVDSQLLSKSIIRHLGANRQSVNTSQ